MMQDSTANRLLEQNEKLLKTIDSLQIQNQLDQISYKIQNQNSIVSEVNSFYDSAWIKLIFVITILGIIIPIIVQYLQRRNFKDLIESAKESFEDKLSLLKRSNDLEIKAFISKYENEIKTLETKNERTLLELDASTFYLQGRALFIEKDFYNAVRSSLKSAILLNKIDRKDRIIPILNNVLRALNHIKEEEIHDFDIFLEKFSDYGTFEDNLAEIQNGTKTDITITAKINELRDIFIKKQTAPKNGSSQISGITKKE